MATIDTIRTTIETSLDMPCFDYRAMFVNTPYAILEDQISPFLLASNTLLAEKINKTLIIVMKEPISMKQRHCLARDLYSVGVAVSGFAGGFVEIGEYFQYFVGLRFYEDIVYD